MTRLASMPLVLAAVALFVVGAAAPASAHTQLIEVDPVEGATVAAEGVVTLTFNEDLLAIGASATVTDSAGTVTSVEVTFPSAASAQVVLPSMAGGDVTLAWRVVASDGHPVEGALAYVAAAPLPPSPSASPTPSPTASAATATATATEQVTTGATAHVTASPTASPSAEGDSSGFNYVALFAAIFAALLASSVAIVAQRRRR